MRLILATGVLLFVCNPPSSERREDPPAAPRTEAPSPEWDRPMPFVDKGWFCASNDCVWSEAAVEEARLIFLDKENPKTAFCYSGAAYRNDINDFYLCSKTLELCKLRRAEFPNGPGSRPCREMTPTEFWQENPMLVELRRKICEPQECPDGYRGVSAAKLKGETLPVDTTAISDLGDGILLVSPSAPIFPGVLTTEDRDCAYGCVLRDCESEQTGCIDTTGRECDLCFDDSPPTADECREFVEMCRKRIPEYRAAEHHCAFKNNKVHPLSKCPRGTVCQRFYDDTAPAPAQDFGICVPSSEAN